MDTDNGYLGMEVVGNYINFCLIEYGDSNVPNPP